MTTKEIPEKASVKAVAVKQQNSDAAPRITAKGEGALAERILDIAFAEGVKVRQDKDLTELLSSFDVESPVPLEALQAVSLILERVYAENNKMRDAQSEADNPVIDETKDGSTESSTDGLPENKPSDRPTADWPTEGDDQPC